MNQTSLIEANLSYSFLQGADLFGAVLGLANFTGAQMQGSSLRGAICAHTIFGNVDLSGIADLDTVVHTGPSILGIETLIYSEGKKPLQFLRECGSPDPIIQFHKSLLVSHRKYHSCFISFTDADDNFSRKLRDDLLDKGVRCWRWKEDAKWGGTLMRQVDENIRDYDRLVVVCSENSLKSEPVIREIERALQREQSDGKEVLFPIRLDDSLFGWDHYLQPDLVRKFAGDFRSWQEPKSYRESFERLLRDLEAEATTIAKPV